MQAASASLARVQQLAAEGFYSPAQFDEARRRWTWRGAAARRASATASHADAGTEVAQAQAQLALAQAATVAAQARLAQTTLVAPADARVLVREVSLGRSQPGKALSAWRWPGSTQLVAQVDERFRNSCNWPAGLGGGRCLCGAALAACVLSIAWRWMRAAPLR